MDDTNFEIYADPSNYDRESDTFTAEGTILLALASQADGPVLELGCGTGRVTIPLARQGIALTGLDSQSHLLEHARHKAAGLPITWVCDDTRTFNLARQYPLIFTYGAVFQHLHTRPEQEAMLAQVRHHLAPDGQFIIDLGFKRPDRMVEVAEEKVWYTFTDDQGKDVVVSGTDHYDHLRQLWYQTSYHRPVGGAEGESVQPVKFTLRYIMPQEMESLLFYNGFTILERYGNWQGEPLTEESYMQIYLCERR